MAVVPRVSSGYALGCDRAGTTTFESVPGLVDVSIPQEAPAKDKSTQASGIRAYLASLRSRSLSLSFRWDHADSTASTTTHAELWTDFLNAVKGNWRLTFPPNPTTSDRLTCRGFISSIDIPSTLGEVVTASVELQLCGPPTWDTV